MPVQKLCKLALLWQEAGFEREAGRLVSWLLKLEPFLTLWCPEKEYDEEEGKRLFAHLRKIEPISGVEPDIHLTLLKTTRFLSALTLDGNETSLGAILADDVEIRAFGPQSASLQFGIKGRSIKGWTRTAAFSEVWLEMRPKVDAEAVQLDFRFIGIKSEMSLSLSFYVKAPSCQIGNEILKTKSLRRFHGEVQTISFGNKLKIESGQPHKVEVIPLAGEGCYWDSEFLVSFELHPFVPQVSFRIC